MIYINIIQLVFAKIAKNRGDEVSLAKLLRKVLSRIKSNCNKKPAIKNPVDCHGVFYYDNSATF